MAFPVQKFQDNYFMVAIIKIMNRLLVSKFCFCFTLQQGAIFTGVVELTLSAFAMLLLLMATLHESEILTMITAELQQLERTDWAEESFDQFPVYVLRNEEKMLGGQQLAYAMLFVFTLSLVLVTFHIVCSIFLLYGAVRCSAPYLLPWTYTVMIEFIMESFFMTTLILLVPNTPLKIFILLPLTLLFCIEFYSWITVVSFYQEIKNRALFPFGRIQDHVTKPGVLTPADKILLFKKIERI